MDPYIGEIRIFAGNFAPKNWALCNGQLMSISANTALFSILGTFYGGDGRVTFALPNLQQRVPMRFGQGPGLSDRTIGEMGGSDTTTLTVNNLPMHNHQVKGTTDPTNQTTPLGTWPAAAAGGRGQRGPSMYKTTSTDTVMLPPTAVGMTGSNQPVSLLQPVLVINYIIALQGIFPPRE